MLINIYKLNFYWHLVGCLQFRWQFVILCTHTPSIEWKLLLKMCDVCDSVNLESVSRVARPKCVNYPPFFCFLSFCPFCCTSQCTSMCVKKILCFAHISHYIKCYKNIQWAHKYFALFHHKSSTNHIHAQRKYCLILISIFSFFLCFNQFS